MRRQQRGITFLGFLMVAAFIGVVVYGGLRLIPVYLEHMAISSALTSVKRELEGEQASPVRIRNALERRFSVEDITLVEPGDFDIERDGDGYVVRIAYEGRAPFLGNLFLVAAFDRQVEIRR